MTNLDRCSHSNPVQSVCSTVAMPFNFLLAECSHWDTAD